MAKRFFYVSMGMELAFGVVAQSFRATLDGYSGSCFSLGGMDR